MAVKPPPPHRTSGVGRSPVFVASLSVVGLALVLAPAAQAQVLVSRQATATDQAAPAVSEVTAAQSVSPDNASGCNDQVCINLTGTGENITSWNTTAYAGSHICTYAEYLDNGTVVATSEEACGGPDVQFSSTWNDPGYFSAGTKLCNVWPGIAGKPCETVG